MELYKPPCFQAYHYLMRSVLYTLYQALFKELWAILMGIVTGKPSIPKWLQGSIIRSAVLVGTTLFLLIARVKVMGAQLPVFTK